LLHAVIAVCILSKGEVDYLSVGRDQGVEKGPVGSIGGILIIIE
jgi:hypothetical protein